MIAIPNKNFLLPRGFRYFFFFFLRLLSLLPSLFLSRFFFFNLSANYTHVVRGIAVKLQFLRPPRRLVKLSACVLRIRLHTGLHVLPLHAPRDRRQAMY